MPFEGVVARHVGAELWLVHAFPMKSTQGIKMTMRETGLVATRAEVKLKIKPASRGKSVEVVA